MFEFFRKLLRGINRMNQQLEALTTEVELTRGVMASAAVLIGSLADRIDELKNDPEQLTALAQSLRDQRTALSAAIEADGDLAQARINEQARLAADQRRREERRQADAKISEYGRAEQPPVVDPAQVPLLSESDTPPAGNVGTDWSGQGGESGGAGASASYDSGNSGGGGGG
jgi:uncharacterized protein YfaS (alpha-2-macroglobulin family)